VCCKVEFSATCRAVVQRSPIDWVCVCVCFFLAGGEPLNVIRFNLKPLHLQRVRKIRHTRKERKAEKMGLYTIVEKEY
jgi:hypothetical protein